MAEEITSSEKNTARIEAFSDGVFGVAITLLAVEIAVAKGTPETNEGLKHALLSMWPMYVAYFASFVQVLFMWMAHHAIFSMIRRTNTQLMLANGFLLMLVVLAPFPTKTLGEFINTDATKSAGIFYNCYLILISLAFNILLATITKSNYGLLIPGISKAVTDKMKHKQYFGFICTVVIAVIAFFNIWAALICNGGMWFYWAIIYMEKKKTVS